jgi:glutaredoxin
LDAQVLGISIDHVPSLKAWAESFEGISYPLLSDFWPHGQVAESYGVLRSEGYSERALFILDKQGIIQYIDIHPIEEQPDNAVLFHELERIDPQAAARRPVEVVQEAPALPHGGIVMYCTSWCPDCKRARAWLKATELQYIEVDINRVPGAADQMRAWTGGQLTTPTFEIDGEILVEFDETRLRAVLKI